MHNRYICPPIVFAAAFASATTLWAGGDNVAMTLQSGTGNTAAITQTGKHNFAAVGQLGQGRTASTTQTGDNEISGTFQATAPVATSRNVTRTRNGPNSSTHLSIQLN